MFLSPLIIDGPVFLGSFLLLGSLFPVCKLVTELPSGKARRPWYILVGMILFFIMGYILFVVSHWNNPGGLFDLIVTLVFFLGACFVLLITSLSLRAAFDLRRVAVLERENITDPLMNLFNRRYLERRLEEEVTRAQRYNLPLSILLLDLDNFKQVNDTYGHQAGDDVLSSFGKIISETVRFSDIVARYGGDEILVITPNTSTSQASGLAERIRMKVESMGLLSGEKIQVEPKFHLTVSIGVASLEHCNGNPRSIVECADEALYNAKHGGRNTVKVND
jgi:diguanylate cyclase (GGDEF)-like protein